MKPLFDDEGVALGLMLSEIRNPSLAVMLATAGMDFFIIDMEHGAYGWESMSSLIATARAVGVEPVVRIPEIRRETVLKPLEAGASGLLVPMVERVEQVEELIEHAKYAPQGRRGTALRRAHSHYRRGAPVEYMAGANEATTIAIQIESRRGLEDVDALAAVPGVDALFIGPFDLSVDLGLPGQTWSRELREAYGTVLEAAKRHGRVAGFHAADIEHAHTLIAEGFQMLSVSSDVDLLVDHATANVEALRARASSYRGTAHHSPPNPSDP